MVKATELVGAAIEKIVSPEAQENMQKTLMLFSKLALDTTALPSGEPSEENSTEACEDEQDSPQEDDSTHDKEE